MIRRNRPAWRGSLAPDVHALLAAMPGDASRYVDAAVRAYAAAQGDSVESLRAARERFEADPLACAACADGIAHTAAEHREAVYRAEQGAREAFEAEQRRDVGWVLSKADTVLREAKRCDSCDALRHPGDSMTLTRMRTPYGIESHYRCAYGCQSVTGSADAETFGGIGYESQRAAVR